MAALQTWWYMGRRQSYNGSKLYHRWLAPADNGATDSTIERQFAAKRGDRPRVIGTAYLVEWDEAERTAQFGEADHTFEEHPDTSTWWAIDHGAAAAQARRRAEASRAKDVGLQTALDQLAEAYGRIGSYDDRAGFLAYVSTRIASGRRS